MRNHIFYFLLLASCLRPSFANAQTLKKSQTLYTAGHASAFIGGLYDAFYPYAELKRFGNFGLGAPDQLDGELLILNGKIYQTQASGKTTAITTGKTPFAVVNFFNADQVVQTKESLTKDQLYAYLDRLMPNQNGIYAIHIKGKFSAVKTRAFPKVTEKPYAPLASMLALQRFFDFEEVTGDLVGYRIPGHMEGPNISGYHFHFLSTDKKGGGHLIELKTGAIEIAIDELNNYTIALPTSQDFKHFDFKKDRREEVKRVENGKAN
jgi:acetolactate decarboxylase